MIDVARGTGLTTNTIASFYHNKATMIRTDTLDRLCAHLGCDVADLIEYVRD